MFTLPGVVPKGSQSHVLQPKASCPERPQYPDLHVLHVLPVKYTTVKSKVTCTAIETGIRQFITFIEGDVIGDDSQRRILAQHSVATLL